MENIYDAYEHILPIEIAKRAIKYRSEFSSKNVDTVLNGMFNWEQAERLNEEPTNMWSNIHNCKEGAIKAYFKHYPKSVDDYSII